MFGYIRTDTPELRVRENEYYKAVYCGMCRAQGKCTGQCSRMTLSYDMVFLDHMMPEMDGKETLHRLKEMKDYPGEKAVVVALTANAVVGARKQYISEGFDDFLPKPIVYKEAEELILKYLPSHLVEHIQDAE